MSDEKTKVEKNSTVAISPDIAKKLELFCKTNNITKKDFISLSLSYFEMQGVNPAKHESPKTEMEKVIKRLDQFFAFLKKQEQDKINPMFNMVTEAVERIKLMKEGKAPKIEKPKQIINEKKNPQDLEQQNLELVIALKEYDIDKLCALSDSGYIPSLEFYNEIMNSAWYKEVCEHNIDVLSYLFGSRLR